MTTEEYIKYCSNIINEGWNPDDPANDDFDKMADDYEEEQKERERFTKELRKAAGLEEAMSVDDILNKHKEKKDSTQDKEPESNIKGVIIKELYDGYCLCEVEMKNGDKKDFEFEITQDEIDDMISKLSAKAKSKNFKKPFCFKSLFFFFPVIKSEHCRKKITCSAQMHCNKNIVKNTLTFPKTDILKSSCNAKFSNFVGRRL